TVATAFATFDGVDLSGDTSLSYGPEFKDAQKLLSINLNFGDTSSPNKKLKIELAKEFYFYSVTGMKLQNGTFVYNPASLPAQLRGIISNITFTPYESNPNIFGGYKHPLS